MSNGKSSSWLDYRSKNGAKLFTAVIVIVALLIMQAVVLGNPVGGYLSGLTKPPGVSNPTLATSAYCYGTGGVVSASALPSTCSTNPVKLQIQLIDLGAQAAPAANTFSCKTFVNTGSGWSQYENILTASSTTTCNSVFTYNPLWQVVVEVCQSTSACPVGTVSTLKTTTVYCALPSASPSIASPCNSGPGSGTVPFGATTSTPPVSIPLTLPFINLVSSSSGGYNANSPDQILMNFLNNTAFTSTATAHVTTNSGALVPGSSSGIFSVTFSLITGQSGTQPTAPFAAGYSSFTPVDPSIQTGATSRGPLQFVLRVEVKATSGSAMCVMPPTLSLTSSTGAATATAIVVSNNSPTDIFYLYVLPDNFVTRQLGSNGGVVSSGLTQASINFDCSQVFNGSAGNTDTLAFNAYPYFSTAYFQYSRANNPEVPSTTVSAANTLTVIN